MATIWMLDEYSQQNLLLASSIKSKTSKPQACGILNQLNAQDHS
jgi:hypothetical protein